MKKIYIVIVGFMLLIAVLCTSRVIAMEMGASRIYGGEILDAQAFPDGSMLILQSDVTSSGIRLWIKYFDVFGDEIYSQNIKTQGGQSIIAQVCGGYVQLVIQNYDYGERYVLAVDGIPNTCYDRVFLPITIK